MISKGAAPHGIGRGEDAAIPLLTAVQFVVRECIHVRGIEVAHVSLAIDDFLSELPRDWSLEEVFKRTDSLRCMQYLAAREPRRSQRYYRSWITNNVIEITLKRGDVKAFKWLAEVYAPDVSITRAAEVAAREARLDVLDWLYRNHRGRVSWGGAELCEAVREGHKEVIEWLRRRVKPSKEVCPQLMLSAARAGDLRVVQWLRQDYNLPVSSALVEAQQGRQWGVVKWILMNCEVEDPSIDMAAIAGDGDMHLLEWMYTNDFGRLTSHALETAAFNGHLNILEWLVEGPASVELSPLVFSEAARGGHLTVVKWLYAHNCPSSTTAMDAAAENGYLDVVQWLYSNRKELCTSRALDRAARKGQLSVIKWLHSTDEKFYCPAAINRAAEFGHLEVVQWLHANRTEGCSTEALDCACHQGHLLVAKWLRANRSEGCGKWAMDLAAASGHLDVVKWLHEELHQSCTPWAMDSAARQGYLDVVKYLHANCDVGCTAEAMSAAAANGHFDVVRWLRRNRTEGCSPTALNQAIAGGHLDVAIFLHREQGLTCSFRSDVTLRGLRLEMVEWLLTTCRNELERGVKFQIARRHLHLNEWMRSQPMEIVEQNDRCIVWEYRPH
ncbi:unnamed protein product [Phytophthora fragariaefolia]|uniref:Unnamed protein product n=1 Tax=Phytophthora fragariaefolia TaxID=1490495 RepID=A0A9W6UBK8_9STRA|nr:unnamed protein product [Phytophthora fragariaefolia]